MPWRDGTVGKSQHEADCASISSTPFDFLSTPIYGPRAEPGGSPNHSPVWSKKNLKTTIKNPKDSGAQVWSLVLPACAGLVPEVDSGNASHPPTLPAQSADQSLNANTSVQLQATQQPETVNPTIKWSVQCPVITTIPCATPHNNKGRERKGGISVGESRQLIYFYRHMGTYLGKWRPQT